MSQVDSVVFPDFENAMLFLNCMRCGVVRPEPDGPGYMWHWEGAPLSKSQQSCYDDYLGIDSIWHDEESQLTWQYSSAYDDNFYGKKIGDERRKPLFAGFSDWRIPTLTELKTLRSNVQDKNGLWRTPALAGKVGGVLRSATDGLYDRDERRDWSFIEDESCEDVYRDSKLVWSNEGSHASFEGGHRTSTGAQMIYVRGTTSNRPLWLQEQVQWSEDERMHDFPVTEKTIELVKELRIWNGKIPPHLNRLTGLRTLEVAGNQSLDLSVFDLHALDSLTWEFNRYRHKTSDPAQGFHLPSMIGDIKGLRQLTVDVPIEHLPEALCDLEGLEDLKLRAPVTTLPGDLGKLSKLRSLDVSSECLAELPSSIGNLSALRVLCIHAKGLQQLPEEIGQLQSLRRLDLWNCALQHLPSAFGQLQALEFLSLNFNQLSAFPDVVCELSQLEELDLSHLPITALPSGFARLQRLKTLNLRGLPIDEVPVVIRELENLEVLNLGGTQIREIPHWVWEMKSLRRLRLAKTRSLPVQAYRKDTSIHVEMFDPQVDENWLKKMQQENL